MKIDIFSLRSKNKIVVNEPTQLQDNLCITVTAWLRSREGHTLAGRYFTLDSLGREENVNSLVIKLTDEDANTKFANYVEEYGFGSLSEGIDQFMIYLLTDHVIRTNPYGLESLEDFEQFDPFKYRRELRKAVSDKIREEKEKARAEKLKAEAEKLKKEEEEKELKQ